MQLQPGDTRWQIDLTRSYGRRGDAYLALGEVASAIADFTTMRKQREQLQARDPQNPVWHRPVAWSYQKLATGLAALEIFLALLKIRRWDFPFRMGKARR